MCKLNIFNKGQVAIIFPMLTEDSQKLIDDIYCWFLGDFTDKFESSIYDGA